MKMARHGNIQWIPACIITLLVATVVNGVEISEDVVQVWFYPNFLKLIQEGRTVEVMWVTNSTDKIETVWANMEKWRESEVAGFSEPLHGAPEIAPNSTDFELSNITYHGFVKVTAKFVGYNTLFVTLYDENNETSAEGQVEMTIALKTDELTTIYTYLAAVLTALVYFLMGTTLNLKVMKGILKRPIGPAVGIFCQYIMMPLIAFGLGSALYPGNTFNDRLLRLGMFLGGCCPGGGSSNMWTHLLGGSLDLSITMTGVSTFIAFGSVPVWVLLLGPVIINDANFVIPYVDMTITVIILIVPCAVGIALQLAVPRSTMVKLCAKIMSPMCALNLLVTFSFGAYSYIYVFTLFTWQMLVAGIALPTLGYVAGSLFALFFQMDVPNIIAIGVETGIQNYTIALIILMLTLDSPAGEIATALPAAFTLFTPVPLLLLLIGRRIYFRKTDLSLKPTTHTTDLEDISKKNGVLKLNMQYLNDLESNGGVINQASDLKDKV